MFFQFFAPQGLKCPATAVYRLQAGKVRMPSQQVAEFYLTGCNSRIFCHFLKTFDYHQ